MGLKAVLKAVGVAGVLAASSWALPSAAQAAEYYYFGDPTANLIWPPCGSPCYVEQDAAYRYLTESSARSVNTRTVCAATYDTAVVCSSDLAVKPLNGQTSRLAYSRATVNGPLPQGRARVTY